MLRPSYSELMEKLSHSPETDDQDSSSYTIVIATSKRARQLIDGREPLADAETDKAVSIAIAEINEGRVVLAPEVPEDETEETGFIPEHGGEYGSADYGEYYPEDGDDGGETEDEYTDEPDGEPYDEDM